MEWNEIAPLQWEEWRFFGRRKLRRTRIPHTDPFFFWSIAKNVATENIVSTCINRNALCTECTSWMSAKMSQKFYAFRRFYFLFVSIFKYQSITNAFMYPAAHSSYSTMQRNRYAYMACVYIRLVLCSSPVWWVASGDGIYPEGNMTFIVDQQIHELP